MDRLPRPNFDTSKLLNEVYVTDGNLIKEISRNSIP